MNLMNELARPVGIKLAEYEKMLLDYSEPEQVETPANYWEGSNLTIVKTENSITVFEPKETPVIELDYEPAEIEDDPRDYLPVRVSMPKSILKSFPGTRVHKGRTVSNLWDARFDRFDGYPSKSRHGVPKIRAKKNNKSYRPWRREGGLRSSF